MPDPVFCIIALGGNTGDTASFFRRALLALEHGGFQVRRVSSFLTTKPQEMAEGTPDFLNGVISGFWDQSPHDLLALCRKIEQDNGRPADHAHYVSRTLDLDIILFGHQTIRDPDLVIPHPRAAERSFVMEPLREIEPEAADWLIRNASRFRKML